MVLQFFVNNIGLLSFLDRHRTLLRQAGQRERKDREDREKRQKKEGEKTKTDADYWDILDRLERQEKKNKELEGQVHSSIMLVEFVQDVGGNFPLSWWDFIFPFY